MNALESLAIASFARGLSVRDVEAALAKALGDQPAISRSTVWPIRCHIKDEYQAWVRRRLDGVKLNYLFLDASFFRMHPGSQAEPVLAAWGITTDGKPAFIGLAPGTGESFDAWKDFLADLRDRGLASAAAHRQRRRGRADRRDRAGLPEGATSALCDPSKP
jgi:putative transposase